MKTLTLVIIFFLQIAWIHSAYSNWVIRKDVKNKQVYIKALESHVRDLKSENTLCSDQVDQEHYYSHSLQDVIAAYDEEFNICKARNEKLSKRMNMRPATFTPIETPTRDTHWW